MTRARERKKAGEEQIGLDVHVQDLFTKIPLPVERGRASNTCHAIVPEPPRLQMELRDQMQTPQDEAHDRNQRVPYACYVVV